MMELKALCLLRLLCVLVLIAPSFAHTQESLVAGDDEVESRSPTQTTVGTDSIPLPSNHELRNASQQVRVQLSQEELAQQDSNETVMEAIFAHPDSGSDPLPKNTSILHHIASLLPTPTATAPTKPHGALAGNEADDALPSPSPSPCKPGHFCPGEAGEVDKPPGFDPAIDPDSARVACTSGVFCPDTDEPPAQIEAVIQGPSHVAAASPSPCQPGVFCPGEASSTPSAGASTQVAFEAKVACTPGGFCPDAFKPPPSVEAKVACSPGAFCPDDFKPPVSFSAKSSSRHHPHVAAASPSPCQPGVFCPGEASSPPKAGASIRLAAANLVPCLDDFCPQDGSPPVRGEAALRHPPDGAEALPICVPGDPFCPEDVRPPLETLLAADAVHPVPEVPEASPICVPGGPFCPSDAGPPLETADVVQPVPNVPAITIPCQSGVYCPPDITTHGTTSTSETTATATLTNQGVNY